MKKLREYREMDQLGNMVLTEKPAGAYVFFEEGEAEITVLFSNPWYYWNQPYVIPLKAGNL